ncbi:hypothetical protein [Accumulibacter sp.]|uniref:hypothetical protein n=1 Tax=Accumulibacter sp. TaxID=2053492 RepID=UPI0025F2322D|nr:hypothetical protein [Accumulibacter sp.]
MAVYTCSGKVESAIPVELMSQNKCFTTRRKLPTKRRTAERLRAETRGRFGFREATVADSEMLTVSLRDHVAGELAGDIDSMIERLEARCRELAIEPPTADRVERIARSALRAHEDRFHSGVYERLSTATRECLDALLRPEGGGSEEPNQDDAIGSATAVLLKLRGSPGRPSLASMQDELAKLELIRGINLPADLFDRTSPRDLERCRQRVSVEVPRDLCWGSLVLCAGGQVFPFAPS